MLLSDDARHAFSHAGNSLLYELDNGPAILEAGMEDDRTRLPRGLAWQEVYAMGLLVKCDGDHARLLAAAEEIRGKIREAQREWAAESPEGAQRYAGAQFYRAIDLCERAMVVIDAAGALSDDKARRRLLIRCRHEKTRTAFGAFLDDDLIDDLADDEP